MSPWDETKVLNGQPAQFIIMARRKGAVWYLGAMTNWDARDLEIPVSFLGSGEYEAEIFEDGPDADKVPTSVKVIQQNVSASAPLKVHLAAGGGMSAILTPIR